MSTSIPEEEFEDGYVLEFRRRLHGRGIGLHYDRDRGAIDLGIRLKKSGTNAVGQTKVWFQLKGLHAATLSADRFEQKGAYADVAIAHLREWYEAPEVVYVAIWVESVGEFVALDVRELVENRWGADLRWEEVGRPGHESIRVWIPPTCVMDEAFVDDLDRHASMRIDTATWRGQYLGHRLDPLRNELEPIDPATFVDLVGAILAAHEFVLDQELNPADVLAPYEHQDGRERRPARLLRGRLFGTLRWPFAMSIEYGFADPEEPREEGQWFNAHGSVYVLVVQDADELVIRQDLTGEALISAPEGANRPVIVFVNAPEDAAGPWRTRGLALAGTPIGLGTLSTLVLLTPAVYRSFADRLHWRRPVNRYS